MAKPTNPTAIRAARLQAGLSVQQAAQAAAIGRTTMYRLEKHASARPSLHVVNALAAALRVEPDALLGRPA